MLNLVAAVVVIFEVNIVDIVYLNTMLRVKAVGKTLGQIMEILQVAVDAALPKVAQDLHTLSVSFLCWWTAALFVDFYFILLD